MKRSNGTSRDNEIWVLQITRNFLMSWTTISLSKRKHWVCFDCWMILFLLSRLPANELIQYFELVRSIRYKHSSTLHSIDRWTATDVSEECTASIKTAKQFKKSSHTRMWEVPQNSVGYANLSANIEFALLTYEMCTAETRRCNIAVRYRSHNFLRPAWYYGKLTFMYNISYI